MYRKELDEFIGLCSLTISEVIQRIDKTANRIIFLVNENDLLCGSISDGDLRRFFMSGGKLTDKAVDASNKKPKTAHSIEEAKSLYHNKNWIAIPVVDETGKLLDVYAGESAILDQPRAALNIPVVINAGGRGTRLDPFTRVLPKPLIPVGDIPIIELIMQEYQNYSCSEFHIIVNYKKDLMKAYFAENDSNYNIAWYDEYVPLGTGGGLSLLKDKVKTTFIFTNCDVLLTADYEAILEFHRQNSNTITMICANKSVNIPYGVVETDSDGILTSMKEKPVMSFLTNTGIYIVEPEVVTDMVDGEPIGFPDIVERQKQMGKKVAVYSVSESEWMDMGQISELEKMRTRLYGV